MLMNYAQLKQTAFLLQICIFKLYFAEEYTCNVMAMNLILM